MGYLELALIGVGLSMDAFAVSVCKGLSMRKVDKKYMFVLAAFFWRISGVDAGIGMASWKSVPVLYYSH